MQDVILQGRALYEDGCFKRYLELAKDSYNMNPQDSEFPEYWIRLAERDNRMGHILCLTTVDPEGARVFTCSKRSEKFFKAYLIRQGWRLVRTHNLVDLLGDASQYDPSMEEFRDVCDEVRKYYFASRYPWEDRWGDPPDMSDDSVRAALAEITPLIDRLRAGSERADIDGQDEQDNQGGV